MKKSNILSGALALTIGGVLSKVFSAIYRIVLTRILGGEGIGIYQLIFPFYSLCVVLATAGLPMAISKVIAKNKEKEASVLKKCVVYVSVISLVLTFILLISSKGLAILQGCRDISLCYIILAPTIMVVGVSSVLRGYFQGKHNFTPSAVSNILEQFVKLCVGFILSLSLIQINVFAGIVGAVVAIVISEVVSLLILLVYIKKEKLKSYKPANVSIKEIGKDVLPITLTNIILPISTFIDSVLVVNLLSINFSNDMSIFLYGLESGAVSSLVSLPTIFSFAIASVILPNITSGKHSLNNNSKLMLALKIVLIITIPCVLAFMLIPNRLIDFLYHNKLNGFGVDGLSVASRLLSWSGLGIVFLAINQVYSSSLQAIEERFVTIRNLSIAVVVKLFIEIVFMPSKFLNIYSLAISNTVCYILVMVLNHLEIKENFKFKINNTFFGKLIFANCVMILTLVFVLAVGNSVVNTLLAVSVSVVVYFVCLWQLKIFNRTDKAIFKFKV